MIFLIVAFFCSLLFGQLAGVQLQPGVTTFLHDGILTVLLVITLISQYKKRNLPRGALIRPILLFVFVACLSLVANATRFALVDLFKGSLYLWRWLLYAGVYLVVINSRTPLLWVFGLYGTGIGFAILGFAQLFLYPSLRNLLYLGWDEHHYRLFSTLLDPNFVSILLVLTMILGLYLTRRLPVWVGGVLYAVPFVALILTYSRSGYMAYAVSLLVLSVWKRWYRLLFLFILGAGLYILIPSPIDANRITRVDSIVSRIENYKESIGLFRTSPILGYGFNTLRSLAAERRLLDGQGIVSRDAGGFDSSIMVIVVTTGLLGGASYAWLILEQLRVFMRRSDFFQVVGVTSITAVLVHSVFNNSLLYPWVLLWVWILVGVGETMVSEKKKIKGIVRKR